MDDSTQGHQSSTGFISQPSAPLMPEPIADGSISASPIINPSHPIDTTDQVSPTTASTAAFSPIVGAQSTYQQPAADTSSAPSFTPMSQLNEPVIPVPSDDANTQAVDDNAIEPDTTPDSTTDDTTHDEVAETPEEPKDADISPLKDASSGNELLDIKQQALEELSPLIDHLDQTPEEKFRTLMMLIQASDDQGLVQAAYAAANAIDDDKARAQALLDVVNEINYFTHGKKK